MIIPDTIKFMCVPSINRYVPNINRYVPNINRYVCPKLECIMINNLVDEETKNFVLSHTILRYLI